MNSIPRRHGECNPVSDDSCARAVIRALLDDGAIPSADDLARCGRWREHAAALADAVARQGRADATRLLARLLRADPDLGRLIGADPAPLPPPASCPPLPAAARPPSAWETPCGFWLDAYCAALNDLLPMTPPDFHEAAGLFLVSLAIARRAALHLPWGAIYPNLYMLYIAPSGYGKSTTLGVMQRLIAQAGMDHLVQTGGMTPEALYASMSMTAPATYDAWHPDLRAMWVRERAFAAQRGFVIDEAGHFFDAMLTREYMNGMLGYLLEWYDCPDLVKRETVGGGRLMLRDLYPTLFAVANPTSMRRHLCDDQLWMNGWWPRVVLLTPEADPTWVDTPFDAHGLPNDLARDLAAIFHRFPTPQVVIGVDRGRTIATLADPPPAAAVPCTGAILQAWNAYRKAVTFDMIGDVDDVLRPWYQRLPTLLMKVAIALAVMDAPSPPRPITMTPPHYARAQEIVERWRATVHRLWDRETRHQEDALGERILGLLQRRAPDGRAGWTLRLLQQYLKQPGSAISQALALLDDAGQATVMTVGRQKRWVPLADRDPARDPAPPIAAAGAADDAAAAHAMR